jgi:hypothetical protein
VHPASGYSPGDAQPPLGGYAVLVAVFTLGMGGAMAALRICGRELPERPRVGDLVLAGIATHKLSRLITRDKVTAFLRGPFTEYQGPAGHGEADEQPRGEGLHYALGELLVCPYCLAGWLAAGFAIGQVAAPRTTRFIAGMYASQTLADFLQLAYVAAENRA